MISMPTRIRRELEPAWVSWYCAKHFPNDIVKPRCPLGPIPKEIKEALGETIGRKVYRPWRPEVDAVVITPTQMILIEAKIQKFMDGLSKLPRYRDLVSDTPELRPWRYLPINMRLLIPRSIPWVEIAADKAGVQVLMEAPDWILDVWEERDKYWTKEELAKREARKAKLRELGYE